MADCCDFDCVDFCGDDRDWSCDSTGDEREGKERKIVQYI